MDYKSLLLLLIIAIFVIELNAQANTKRRKKPGIKKQKVKIARTKNEDDEFKKWKVSLKSLKFPCLNLF